MAYAIGQAFDLPVPAETKGLGARLAQWPAALSRAQFEQRASGSTGEGYRLLWRRGLRREIHEDLMLGESSGAPSVALSFGLPGEVDPGARQTEAVHLANDRIAGYPDLDGDLAA
jgi:hypothetical protein